MFAKLTENHITAKFIQRENELTHRKEKLWHAKKPFTP